MSDDGDTTMNVSMLGGLIEALGGPMPVARVGVLGGKAARDAGKDAKKAPTNATIGAAHEFGTTRLPQRSFLRVPIADHLEKRMMAAGALDLDTLQAVLKEKTVVPWLQKVAILAEAIVLEAFDTGGYGKWYPSRMKNKKVKQTLVETQQLRDSITSEVKG